MTTSQLKCLSSGNHRRSEQFRQDKAAAKLYFPDGRVPYTSAGRIRWAQSETVWTDLFRQQYGNCHWCRKPMNKHDYTTRGTNRVCGRAYPTIEHIVDLAHGGRDHPSNLKMAHLRCNMARN